MLNDKIKRRKENPGNEDKFPFNCLREKEEEEEKENGGDEKN